MLVIGQDVVGFQMTDDVTSQLLLTIQDLADRLNNGEQIDCILLNFSKAFDKVPHQRLINKCNYYGREVGP
jgi:hypothetical protein